MFDSPVVKLQSHTFESQVLVPQLSLYEGDFEHLLERNGEGWKTIKSPVETGKKKTERRRIKVRYSSRSEP